MALNLRAGTTQIPGPVYSGSYAWGTDVPTGTGILNISNPSPTKSVKVIGISVGGWNSGNTVRAVTFNICRSVKTSAGTLVAPTKFDTTSPNAIGSLEAGGSWTLGTSVKLLTGSASNGQTHLPVELDTELTLKLGEGLSIVFLTESGTQVFYPNASITWYEV